MGASVFLVLSALGHARYARFLRVSIYPLITHIIFVPPFSSTSTFLLAAHEVPSENLITQLANAYNTEVGTYLPRPECMKLGTKLTECVNKIKAKADEDKEIKKWVQAYDKARQTAGRCFNKVMEQGDPSKIEKCGPPLLDITDKYCSTEAYRNECGTGPPLLFEHFVLDTAEELVVGKCYVVLFLSVPLYYVSVL